MLHDIGNGNSELVDGPRSLEHTCLYIYVGGNGDVGVEKCEFAPPPSGGTWMRHCPGPTIIDADSDVDYGFEPHLRNALRE